MINKKRLLYLSCFISQQLALDLVACNSNMAKVRGTICLANFFFQAVR